VEISAQALTALKELEIGKILKYNINKYKENQTRRTKDYEAV
jgi:hypothetical protein